jgi:hypothetical protein
MEYILDVRSYSSGELDFTIVGAGVQPFRASLSFDIPPLAGDEVQDKPLPQQSCFKTNYKVEVQVGQGTGN